MNSACESKDCGERIATLTKERDEAVAEWNATKRDRILIQNRWSDSLAIQKTLRSEIERKETSLHKAWHELTLEVGDPNAPNWERFVNEHSPEVICQVLESACSELSRGMTFDSEGVSRRPAALAPADKGEEKSGKTISEICGQPGAFAETLKEQHEEAASDQAAVDQAMQAQQYRDLIPEGWKLNECRDALFRRGDGDWVVPDKAKILDKRLVEWVPVSAGNISIPEEAYRLPWPPAQQVEGKGGK